MVFPSSPLSSSAHLHSLPMVTFEALNESLIFDESEVFPDEAAAVIFVLASSEVGIASSESSSSVYSPGSFRAIFFFNSNFFFLHMPSNKLRSRVLSICLWLLIPFSHESVTFNSPLINAFSIIYEKNNPLLALIPLIAKGVSASLAWIDRFLWLLPLFRYYPKPWFNAFIFGWFLQILLYGSHLTDCGVELRTIYDGLSKAVSSSATILLLADSAGVFFPLSCPVPSPLPSFMYQLFSPLSPLLPRVWFACLVTRFGGFGWRLWPPTSNAVCIGYFVTGFFAPKSKFLLIFCQMNSFWVPVIYVLLVRSSVWVSLYFQLQQGLISLCLICWSISLLNNEFLLQAFKSTCCYCLKILSSKGCFTSFWDFTSSCLTVMRRFLTVFKSLKMLFHLVFTTFFASDSQFPLYSKAINETCPYKVLNFLIQVWVLRIAIKDTCLFQTQNLTVIYCVSSHGLSIDVLNVYVRIHALLSSSSIVRVGGFVSYCLQHSFSHFSLVLAHLLLGVFGPIKQVFEQIFEFFHEFQCKDDPIRTADILSITMYSVFVVFYLVLVLFSKCLELCFLLLLMSIVTCRSLWDIVCFFKIVREETYHETTLLIRIICHTAIFCLSSLFHYVFFKAIELQFLLYSKAIIKKCYYMTLNNFAGKSKFINLWVLSLLRVHDKCLPPMVQISCWFSSLFQFFFIKGVSYSVYCTPRLSQRNSIILIMPEKGKI